MPYSMIPFDADARQRMLQEHANAWLALAVENILQEYPHMPWIIADNAESYPRHRDSHPAFFGSFDWHSCVEMYRVAVRLMRLFPGLPHESEARSTIGSLLTREHIETETAYFQNPWHRGFERPYGWGWLLTLWHELHTWDDPDAARWREILRPLAERLMDLFGEWLPRMTYPQRIGMHSNTAFGLTMAWDAAAAHRPGLVELFRERAMSWFGRDVRYPFAYEPSGADFLSAGLCEAVLMSRVMPGAEFRDWLEAFMPDVAEARPASLFTPATVTDSSDGQIAHLHGLNLSRAWAFLHLAAHLPEQDAGRTALEDAARVHAEASLGEVSGSHYNVEHWLAAYATLMLSD